MSASAVRPIRLAARNPRTGIDDYHFDVASTAQVQQAAAVLRAAQPAWQALGFAGRRAVLQDFAAAIDGERDALIAALAVDTGRQRIAAIEVAGMLGLLQLALANGEQVLAPAPEHASMIPGIAGRRQLSPYPLVGVIAPWNFPLLLSMIDTLPALVAGCSVLVKPSEVTPRYVDPLQRAIDRVPALASVLRIVRGPGDTGADVVDQVDAVVVTGSVRTGRLVAEQAARRFIPAFLELGGKDPLIVLASADVERASDIALRASVLATGQACQSLERVYVDRRIYTDFMTRLIAKAKQVRTTADDPHGHIGPFIMGRQAQIVRGHLEDAVARGARIEAGGHLIERGGIWCEATVLSNVNHDMKVMREETFGPVIPVMAFDTVEEAIALANDSEYGLSANVLAGSEDEAFAIARRLQAGFISINDCSMSSMVSEFEWEAFRDSGMGRSRMGPSGVARYLRVQAVVINRGPTGDVLQITDQ